MALLSRADRGLVFFFFQAEDGIRDKLVTGVQTCALPILLLQVDDDPLAGDLIGAFVEDGTVAERDRLLRLVEDRALSLGDAVAALDADVAFGDDLLDFIGAAAERTRAWRRRRRRGD